MILTCNRIILPYSDDDDPALRRAREDAPREHVKRRRLVFHIGDVEKFTEHEDRRWVTLYFTSGEALVTDLAFDELEKHFRDFNEPPEDDDEDHEQPFTFFLPAN